MHITSSNEGAFARRRKVRRTERRAKSDDAELPRRGRHQGNPVLGRCGARVHGSQTMRPGGVGAPPGGTMAPCQELADGCRVLAKALTLRQKARPGAETRTPRWRAGQAPTRVPATGA